MGSLFASPRDDRRWPGCAAGWPDRNRAECHQREYSGVCRTDGGARDDAGFHGGWGRRTGQGDHRKFDAFTFRERPHGAGLRGCCQCPKRGAYVGAGHRGSDGRRIGRRRDDHLLLGASDPGCHASGSIGSRGCSRGSCERRPSVFDDVVRAIADAQLAAIASHQRSEDGQYSTCAARDAQWANLSGTRGGR